MDSKTKLSRSTGLRHGRRRLAVVMAIAASGIAAATPALAQYKQEVGNDMRRCSGPGPAVLIAVDGVKSSRGKMRVQAYHATAADWLQKGRWLSRIEVPAKAGTMTFCVPVPSAGRYAIAIRHDVNGNDETDITTDGGGMSNNPGFSIFNLGKPSVTKTAFAVGNEVKSIRIQMKYL